MKDKNITISLSEYKELLLKERPSDNDKWLLGKIKEFISSEATLDKDYGNIKIDRYSDFEIKILDFIKIVDMDFYKEIVKKCYDNAMEQEEIKLRVNKMNAIKELNKEAKNNE